MKNIFTPGLLRIIALIILLAGAICSLGLMIHAGRNNKSVLLLLVFAIWVLSPFIALLVANAATTRLSHQTRIRLYILILVLTIGSLVFYSGTIKIAGTKNAFVFLIFPFISWLFIAIVIPISALLPRRRSHRNNNI